VLAPKLAGPLPIPTPPRTNIRLDESSHEASWSALAVDASDSARLGLNSNGGPIFRNAGAAEADVAAALSASL
jgi:hypothetical protein